MTYKITKVLLCSLLSVLFFMTGCQKKEFEKYYERPDSLADPIYQQLQQRGKFTNLLKVIDKSGYKATLSAAGSWTFFAPDDDAFKAFLTEKGLTSVDAITEDLAKSIVRYSLTYDAEKVERLSDYLSATGWLENQAWRRRSVYYDFVYDGKNETGQPIKVIDANRNGSYLPTDFNNKYLPVFTQDFMTAQGIPASDYQYFYPGSTFSGFNVGPANVRSGEKDIVAENGVIHVIDKVLTPPLSFDQYVSSKPEYSAFKALLDKFATYTINTDVSRRYQVLSGKSDNVYAKVYNFLAFNPNNQNYLRIDPNDAQTNAYSFMAPTNAAVNNFIKDVLLKHYPSGTTVDQLFQLNSSLLRDFITSHMYTTAVWPSQFKSNSSSGLGERPSLELSDVNEKYLLSNGMFYGVNKAQSANVFSTVYGAVYLDPKYSLMLKAMEAYGYSLALKLPSIKFAIIPISDKVLASLGFTYDPLFNTAPFRYKGAADNIILRRIIASHIIDMTGRTVPDFNGEGFLKTIGDEYIRYKSNRLISAGTLDSAVVATQSVKVDSIRTFTNGPSLYANGAMSFTSSQIGVHIEKFGTTTTQPYYKFFQYLKQGTNLFNNTNKEIAGVSLGVNHTFFIPTNAAMDQAVRDGLLPGTVSGSTVTSNFNPTLSADRAKIANFILYHIVGKITLAPDGIQTGAYETLLKDSNASPVLLTIVTNTTSSIQIRDAATRIVDVATPNASYLSNRAILHQINSYLKY